MTRRDAVITNRLGLHARAAARFVAVASTYEGEIAVSQAEKRVSGKSIMGLMMLAAGQHTTLTIEAEGPDAEAAVEALATLVENGFDEESDSA
ncbi:HPr family phosphocarrier protein [Halorhodospira neutriphila]|uniref:Phosphocarrier protein HPr n=1 Tax=Halorhodospira neutriphila TaxID=168379 RepID=A0ABS1E7Y2_9GAMM|nr:HPr family phosphocarrier protein [Halorhodospira neutriphila]MBK1726536.1 phosphocarrier protein HPr [Halorhodospira neutriphila]